MRVLVLQRLCDAPAPAFSGVSRLRCFDCEKTGHSTIHCPSINVMCEKRLVHHDANERLCWGRIEDEDVDICLPQDQIWEEKITRQAKDQAKATMHIEAAAI